MERLKKLYGETNMSWPIVLLFAVIAGVYTAAVNMIPLFNGTSFQDIAISHEWWVIFAVIVVVNCHAGWEAMLKCFVFFAISQPIVFLVQVAFGYMTMDMGMYYLRNWVPMIILTLPGGFIAYFCKKQNVGGSIVLGLGNTIELVLGISYLLAAIRNFPYHILTTVVCFVSIFVMTFCIQKEKKNRVVALLTCVCVTAVLLVLLKMTGRTL